MMRFKLWIKMTENLAGPGGGPESQPEDQAALARNIVSKGAGAFPTGGDNPPKPRRTATKGYEDLRFCRRYLKK